MQFTDQTHEFLSLILDSETEKGMLILRGNNIHVGKLNLDEGEVSVDGLIDTIEYSEGGISKGKNSFLNRIFK